MSKTPRPSRRTLGPGRSIRASVGVREMGQARPQRFGLQCWFFELSERQFL
jgi:hypothetical protein